MFFSQTSELGVTEHVEGDPCKFALWVGRTPTSDNKIVLKVRITASYALLYVPCVVRLMLIMSFSECKRCISKGTLGLRFVLPQKFKRKMKIIFNLTQFTFPVQPSAAFLFLAASLLSCLVA